MIAIEVFHFGRAVLSTQIIFSKHVETKNCSSTLQLCIKNSKNRQTEL